MTSRAAKKRAARELAVWNARMRKTCPPKASYDHKVIVTASRIRNFMTDMMPEADRMMERGITDPEEGYNGWRKRDD